MFTSKLAFCVCHRQRLQKESGQIIKESYQKDFCFFLWDVKIGEPGENLLKIENQLLLNSIKFLLLLNFVMSKMNLNFT